MKMLHKLRIALAVTILALAAVSADDSASAGGLRTRDFRISTDEFGAFITNWP